MPRLPRMLPEQHQLLVGQRLRFGIVGDEQEIVERQHRVETLAALGHDGGQQQVRLGQCPVGQYRTLQLLDGLVGLVVVVEHPGVVISGLAAGVALVAEQLEVGLPRLGGEAVQLAASGREQFGVVGVAAAHACRALGLRLRQSGIAHVEVRGGKLIHKSLRWLVVEQAGQNRGGFARVAHQPPFDGAIYQAVNALRRVLGVGRTYCGRERQCCDGCFHLSAVCFSVSSCARDLLCVTTYTPLKMRPMAMPL